MQEQFHAQPLRPEEAPSATKNEALPLSEVKDIENIPGALRGFIAEVKKVATSTAGSFRTGVRFLKILKKVWETPRAPVYSSLDLTYAGLNTDLEKPENRYGNIENKKQVVERSPDTAKEYVGTGHTVLVFLPWGSEVGFSDMAGLIPKWDRVVAFTTPGGFVNKDPQVTKEIFMKVIDDAEEEIRATLEENPDMRFDVISYSAANGAGFYAANTLLEKKNQGRFISIASGSGLGREIFESDILAPIRKDAEKEGIGNGDVFNAGLRDKKRGLLLPIHHCDKLPNETEIIVGDNDVYIPAHFAVEIGEEARHWNPNVKITHYPFGHIGTILYKAHLEQLKHQKTIISVMETLDPNIVSAYDELFKKRGLELPREDIEVWSAVFTVLCRETTAPENIALRKRKKEEGAEDTIEGIAHDFLVSILPEANKGFASWLSRVSEIGRRTKFFSAKAA